MSLIDLLNAYHKLYDTVWNKTATVDVDFSGYNGISYADTDAIDEAAEAVERMLHHNRLDILSYWTQMREAANRWDTAYPGSDEQRNNAAALVALFQTLDQDHSCPPVT